MCARHKKKLSRQKSDINFSFSAWRRPKMFFIIYCACTFKKKVDLWMCVNSAEFHSNLLFQNDFFLIFSSCLFFSADLRQALYKYTRTYAHILLWQVDILFKKQRTWSIHSIKYTTCVWKDWEQINQKAGRFYRSHARIELMRFKKVKSMSWKV